jgi:ferredoxin
MKRYLLKYTLEAAQKPILSEAILETGVKLNILNAEVEGGQEILVISVVGDAKEERKIISYLRKKGLEVERLTHDISKDDDLCIDCLACYGICPTEAISIGDWRMLLDEGECIRCGACVQACPTKALKLKD